MDTTATATAVDVLPPRGYALDESYVAYHRDHAIEIYQTESERLVARLPSNMTPDVVSLVCLAYERGHDDGRALGKVEKAVEIRRALDL
jgi:hypothetical protein